MASIGGIAARISVRVYARGLAAEIAGLPPEPFVSSAAVAVAVLCGVTAAGLVLTTWRLATMEVR